MTNFGWWAQLAPPGYFMCQVCFASRHVSEAWKDEAGTKWDICEMCKAIEWAVQRERTLKEEIVELVEEIKETEGETAQAKIQAKFYEDAYDQAMWLAEKLLAERNTLRQQVDQWHDSANAAENDVLIANRTIIRLTKELDEFKAKRTLGGPAHGYTPEWRP